MFSILILPEILFTLCLITKNVIRKPCFPHVLLRNSNQLLIFVISSSGISVFLILHNSPDLILLYCPTYPNLSPPHTTLGFTTPTGSSQKNFFPPDININNTKPHLPMPLLMTFSHPGMNLLTQLVFEAYLRSS